MADKENILVVDDEPSIRKYLQTLLEVDGYGVEAVSSGKEALERIGTGERPDYIVLDVLMPEMDGLETLRQLMQIDRTLNVIMLSCSNEVTTVVEAIRIGALDYLTKPFEKPELDAAFLKCRQKKELRSENKSLREYCEALTEDLSFLAASPQMLKIRQQVLQIAPVDVPVFISGESGVGKEVIARMIHLRSTRRVQPFIKVNCAALPGELLESELFGYEQGAFTGAVRAKPGKFELANKGTIFLDEIAEMSPHLQAKLLHVLQDGQFSRLGARAVVNVDVRVLAATNVDVKDAMRSGRFREDLYYRLNVLSIHIPPLRERTTEIPLLFRHFLAKYSEKYAKPAFARSGAALPVARQFARTRELREALRDFGRRRRQFPRTPGNDRPATSHRSARRNSSAKGTGTEGPGSRIERRSGDGSHRRRTRENELVPQRRGAHVGYQLQGAAVQNAAIQSRFWTWRAFGGGESCARSSRKGSDGERIGSERFSSCDSRIVVPSTQIDEINKRLPSPG
jgi:two-component system, NtrC family, response regulator AtoC